MKAQEEDSMQRTTNIRLITILLIPMLLIPVASLVYAHFTDSVEKKYKIHVKFPVIEIGSYKVLSKWDDRLIKKWLVDDTLTIQTKVFPGWYAWIGLVLHNAGDQPVTICEPTYTVYDPNNVWQYFTHTEYLYGPYDKGEFATADPMVWDGLKWWQLPPDAVPTPPPVVLDPSHKLILWVKLKFSPTISTSYTCEFTIKISISVPCTPDDMTEASSWTWGKLGPD